MDLKTIFGLLTRGFEQTSYQKKDVRNKFKNKKFGPTPEGRLIKMNTTADGVRTRDVGISGPVLYQLSYKGLVGGVASLCHLIQGGWELDAQLPKPGLTSLRGRVYKSHLAQILASHSAESLAMLLGRWP